jgi:hypothetical protein
LGFANTVTPFVGGLPRPRLTCVSATGEGGESAAAVDSMTADATAEAARTGLPLPLRGRFCESVSDRNLQAKQMRIKDPKIKCDLYKIIFFH